MNMIEKVARAICEARQGTKIPDERWAGIVKNYRDLAENFPEYARVGGDMAGDAFRDARAALKAMKEPTTEMRLAGADAMREHCGLNAPASSFQYTHAAMITAALEGK